MSSLRDELEKIPHSKDWSNIHPDSAVPTAIGYALPCLPDCPRCLMDKLLVEHSTLLRMAYSRPSMPLSRAIKEVGQKPDCAYETLRADRDKFRLWAGCGGVPTGHKCRVDGHEIYGGFISDPKGDICECHMMQEAMLECAQLEQKLIEAQAATVEQASELLSHLAAELRIVKDGVSADLAADAIEHSAELVRALSPGPDAKQCWELEWLKDAIGDSPLLVRGHYEQMLGEFTVDHVVADSVSIADLDRQLKALPEAKK